MNESSSTSKLSGIQESMEAGYVEGSGRCLIVSYEMPSP